MNKGSSETHAKPPALPLSQRLAHATRAMHRRAECSGVMNALLRGQLEPVRYCLLLRNLHALYTALEGALDHERAASLAPIRMPGIYRAKALRQDLTSLYGDRWRELTIAPAMRSYVARIEAIAHNTPSLLAAHAYVRYMGDMSGGQILKTIVNRAIGQPGKGTTTIATAFYEYGDGADVAIMKNGFRDALDALPVDEETAAQLSAEAVSGFARHVELFDQLGATGPSTRDAVGSP
jgi:heme oxygenase (biliverdin-producing, ferredoxin)